jgi:hypothetical protein
MVNVPSRPEVITVNSEALQTQIRDLLPSQNGFGSELQASNVITPIIDLTRSAEGSNLALDLQTAIAFGSQTAFAVNNTATTIANSPGFYRVIGCASHGGSAGRAKISLSDGVTTKDVWQNANGSTDAQVIQVDLIFWLAAGESLIIESNNNLCNFDGSVRQVGNSLGQLVNPSGFPL